jgi:chromosome segregation ATPase
MLDANAHDIDMHIFDATQLASALAKLESTEEQLRTLQATLIAERVARSQVERDVRAGEGDLRDMKGELGSAVRALRRAKEEGKRNEEERRRLARSLEETKVQ